MGVVLTATAVVSSPSLWMLYEGSLSTDEAAKRVLVCLALCWVALTAVAAVAFPGPSGGAGGKDPAGTDVADRRGDAAG
jgi:hypothetical protein